MDESTKGKLAAVAAIGFATLGVAAALYVKTRKGTKRSLATITKLIVYPIKSCPGIELPSVICTSHGVTSVDGLLRDRLV